MSFRDPIKPQATNKQIRTHNLFLNFILFQLHSIAWHAYKNIQPGTCFKKALRLDESLLPSSGIDTGELKNVQK